LQTEWKRSLLAIDCHCAFLLRWLKLHRRGKPVSQIETALALTAFYGEPTVLATRKNLDHVDAHVRAFIARSPFLVMSTANADGWPDASPRGDAPGFVTVEDPHTLLLPDRPGNNRVDSFTNIMANPKVGMLFLIPGQLHSLRINGTAALLTDDALCDRFSVNGKPARAVLKVTPSQVFFHCGKSLIRSRIWEPAQWPDRTGLPSLGVALAEQIKTIEAASVEAMLAESIAKRLY
jgi:PPOX class probable FMN-dependent enzyme